MPGQAQITSVEALEAFRADLIVFTGQMRPVLDELASEMVHLKSWLQDEQRQFWENQIRLRRRRLEDAQAELFNARFSSLQTSASLHAATVQKAQRAVQEAEQKITLLKKWDRDLENLAEPHLKQLDQLQGFLATDMQRAVAYLTQVIQALAAYTDTAAGPAPDNTPTPP
jgi:predicted HicB family RNase H-like nuclease